MPRTPCLGGAYQNGSWGTPSLTSFFTSFPLALALLLLAVAGELVWGARASGGRAGTRGGGSAAPPEPASFPFFFWGRKQQRCHQRPTSLTSLGEERNPSLPPSTFFFFILITSSLLYVAYCKKKKRKTQSAYRCNFLSNVSCQVHSAN